MPKLYDLQYGRKFSMMDDDVIAMADSYDGYASWQIRIANYGLLIEQVEFRQCDGKPLEEFNVELPDGYVESLQQKAMSVGFASFPNQFETKIDIFMALSYTLVIRTEGELKRVHFRQGADWEGEQGLMIEKFDELWDMVHLHAPYPRDLPNKVRTKRQLKMDARRERRHGKED